jgi:hypothetical protein
MSLRKTFFVICLIVSVLCLSAGYGIAGHWIGAIIAILLGPAWLLARKYSDSQLPLLCLLGSVGFAVVGRLIGAPSLWMIFGSAVALAVWDLLLLDSALGNDSSLEQTRHYENKHLQSLALALGSGLFATLLGSFLKIQMPFIVLMLFVIFILFSLDRVWGYIKKTGKARK